MEEDRSLRFPAREDYRTARRWNRIYVRVRDDFGDLLDVKSLAVSAFKPLRISRSRLCYLAVTRRYPSLSLVHANTEISCCPKQVQQELRSYYEHFWLVNEPGRSLNVILWNFVSVDPSLCMQRLCSFFFPFFPLFFFFCGVIVSLYWYLKNEA